MTPSLLPRSPREPRPKHPGEHRSGHQQTGQWLHNTPVSVYYICNAVCKLGTGSCDTSIQECKKIVHTSGCAESICTCFHPVLLDLVDLHREWFPPCIPHGFAWTNPIHPLLGKFITVPRCLPRKTNSNICRTPLFPAWKCTGLKSFAW